MAYLVPRFNSATGGFRGGINTNYRPECKPGCRGDKDDETYRHDDSDEAENNEEVSRESFNEKSYEPKKPQRRPGARYTSKYNDYVHGYTG